ncbi:MAG: B12-binding domain-containing radical SAM protein, partial [Acetobacteraceae bacterium]|nr:B12-binding domain-containing radical SAM protein [Acetobacteraceae bacterium]
MTEVLLVNLWNDQAMGTRGIDFVARLQHLGLGHLSAFLQANGHSVGIVDGDALLLEDQAVIQRVAAERPRLVGLTFTCATYLRARDVARRLKGELGEATLFVAGGHHATLAAQAILTEPDTPFDAVVLGEGETALTLLVEAISSGRSITEVPGLVVRGGHATPPAGPPPAIDTLPFPDRRPLEEAARRGHSVTLSLAASRGCWRRCAFCSMPSFYRQTGRPRWRPRRAESVAAEVETLVAAFGGSRHTYPLLYFVDDQFIDGSERGRARAHEIARATAGVGGEVYFKFDCRADAIGERDLPLLEELREAGLVSVFVGLESCLQGDLDYLQKDTATGDNERVLELLDRAGIAVPAIGY